MQSLDPLGIDPRGLHLIEASAGTGKTFTITLLYLRLLLEEALEVDRILVVTFTNAATEELRDRIRRRLRTALLWLERGIGAVPRGEDPDLAALLERQPDPDEARQVLRDSLTRLDESAVHTIHGFCHRMLQEHAFQSGIPFEAELTGDEASLARSAMADFWRRRIVTLGPDDARWLKARQWTSPDALLQAVSGILSADPIRLLPDTSAPAGPEPSKLFAEIQGLWAARREEVTALLQSHSGLNRRSYSSTVVANAIQAMDRLVEVFDPALLESKEIGRFLPATLAAHTKSGGPPEHPLFDRVQALREAVGLENELRRARLLAEAREYVREALARRKTDRRLLAYDDLLRRLAEAIEGEGGEGLAQRIRERFPAALIDEFQDTDPLQYRIFQRLYRNQPGCRLFLIGDPKQAIYAFRGADIFTYMQARRDVAGEGAEHTLGTNWRSSRSLVRAVNTLFEGGGCQPFVYPDIPFHPVQASGRADAKPLVIEGERPVAMELRFLPSPPEISAKNAPVPAEDARELAAEVCAEGIAELLRLARGGTAKIGDQPLRAGDIAVLVRTHREGDLMQRALRRRGIRSAALGRESVFAAEEAAELATLLAAVAEPGREGLMRAALVSGLIGTPAAELDALTRDDTAWQGLVERFRGYREHWLQMGFMTAFLRLLHDQEIPARLLRWPDGERRMTNLLQLGELLHLAAPERPGPEGLLRWLAERRADPTGDEAQELRLESDEHLVQIVTLHKSKGLEYPVVFLPFPWSSPDPAREPLIRFHHPDDGYPSAYLGEIERDTYLPLAAEEALAEGLRLLYVAVTRARHLCVLCWGRISRADRSALAYLLHRDTDDSRPASRMASLGEAEIRADLEALAARSGGAIRVRDAAPPAAAGPLVPAATAVPLRAAEPRGRIDGAWRLVSYSGLVSGRDSELPDYDASAAPEPDEPPSGPVDPAFQFPRGVAAGHCLHGLMEQVDFPSVDRESLEATARGMLERFGLERRWSPVAADLVLDALETPLDADGTLRLRDVPRSDRLSELEFHYPLARLEATDLRGRLGGFADYRRAGQGLNFQPAEGLMHGFIDLVFRRRGRYFIADYKSNHLGNRLTDYAAPGLARAMDAHRYDLQYLVYSVALHRYLRRRLAGYDYDAHFGGAYYLFVRGMRPAEGARFGVFFDRPERAVVEALDRLFAGAPGR